MHYCVCEKVQAAEIVEVKGHEKCICETLYNEIKFVLSVKESNFIGKKRSKFSHLLTVRAKVADPPLPPPYGQPDRKISVFYDFPK